MLVYQFLYASSRQCRVLPNIAPLENEDGNLVYEVGIGLQEIYVDAGNGQVLYTETVGKGDEIDDSQAKSSIQIPLTDDSDEP